MYPQGKIEIGSVIFVSLNVIFVNFLSFYTVVSNWQPYNFVPRLFMLLTDAIVLSKILKKKLT